MANDVGSTAVLLLLCSIRYTEVCRRILQYILQLLVDTAVYTGATLPYCSTYCSSVTCKYWYAVLFFQSLRHAIFYVHGHQVAFIETYFWQFSVSFLHRRYERYFWRAVFAPVTLNFKNIEISTCSYTMCGLCSTRSRIQRVAPKRLRDIRFEWFDTIFERFEKLTPMGRKSQKQARYSPIFSFFSPQI